MPVPETEAENWRVSPYNADEDVRGDMALPSDVTVMDLTLRESRQMDGVSLDLEEVKSVAERLDQAGIPTLEMHHDDPNEIREVAELNLEADIMALIHPTAALDPETAIPEIEECVDAGADIVCLAFAISPYNFGLYESMADLNIQREEALTLACESVAAAETIDVTVSCLLMDFTRPDLEWVKTVTREFADAGADIVRMDDICAPCLPAVVKHHISELKSVVPDTPIAIHTHDDFGLATATQFAALEGGAEILEGTVNGFGERAGVPPISELVAALELFYGYDTGIELEAMTALSDFVADVYNQPKSPFLPGVGERVFSHAAEVHYVLPEDDRWSFNAWAPEVTGNDAYVPLCHHSGPYSIHKRAQTQELDGLSQEEATNVLEGVREELRVRQHPMSDKRFEEIVRSVVD